MIEINLLPANMRRAEATPLPRFAAICLGTVACLSLLVINLHYMVRIVPDEEQKLADTQAMLAQKQKEAARLDELQKEIDSIKQHVDVIRGLYKKRHIWSKILYDLKRIVTFDPALDEENPPRRYLWLSKLEFKTSDSKDDAITLEGYASSSDDETEAFGLVQLLLAKMSEYQNKERPEEQEARRIREELEKEQKLLDEYNKRYRKQRLVDPGAKKSKEMVVIEKKIAKYEEQIKELESKQSGGLAMIPFSQLFEPGMIDLKQTDFGKAPKGARSLEGAPGLPRAAHKFKFDLTFEKPEAPTAGPPRR